MILSPVTEYQFHNRPIFQSPAPDSRMATTGEQQQDEDAAELTFPKEFENAETLLISEVS